MSNNLNSSSLQTYSNSPNNEDKLHQLQSEYDDLKMELTRVNVRWRSIVGEICHRSRLVNVRK